MTDRSETTTTHAPKVTLVVQSFPRVKEGFIVRRFLGLLERGWDVTVSITQGIDDEWERFPELASSPDIRRRVRRLSKPLRRASFVLRLPVAFVRTFVKAPDRAIRALLSGWRVVRPRTVARLETDAKLATTASDIIHFQHAALAVGRTGIAEMLGCALVVSFELSDVSERGRLRPRRFAKIWEHADAIHLSSAGLLERARTHGLPPTVPTYVVLDGVDPSAFDPHDRCHEDPTGTPDRPLRILTVAELRLSEGHAHALRAVRLLREAGIECKYRIVGEGDSLELVRTAVRDLELEDRVEIRDWLPEAAIREEMLWADVFLSSSVARASPAALVQAQAMRLPVVTTDCGGIREIILDGRTGYLVRRWDPSAVATRLAELARDPQTRQRMGEAGRERMCECFSLESNIRATEQMYLEAMSNRRARAG